MLAAALLRRAAASASPAGSLPRLLASALLQDARRLASQPDGGQSPEKWRAIVQQGHDINPCNSELHPAVQTGAIQPVESEPVLCVQEAYTPESSCFGCGPAADNGLGLLSFRIPNGLQARLDKGLASKFNAFPGIINGGIISTLFDCHGNWTAAVALMDRSFLPRPPLTLTKELLVNFKEPTPPGQPLVVRSHVATVKDGKETIGKATVQVDMTLHLDDGGRETLLATCSGVFKKVGAMRAL